VHRVCWHRRAKNNINLADNCVHVKSHVVQTYMREENNKRRQKLPTSV